MEQSGARAVSVRTARDLEEVDGLIIPGGESTAMLKLLFAEGLFEPLRDFGQAKPVFGTCAGAILLASEVQNPKQASLALMNMTVERNGYGRQVDSRIITVEIDGQPTEAVFIRAPIIRRTGPDHSILATYQATPILVREGKHLAATFHPELSSGSNVHAHFVKMVEHSKSTANSKETEQTTG